MDICVIQTQSGSSITSSIKLCVTEQILSLHVCANNYSPAMTDNWIVGPCHLGRWVGVEKGGGVVRQRYLKAERSYFCGLEFCIYGCLNMLPDQRTAVSHSPTLAGD